MRVIRDYKAKNGNVSGAMQIIHDMKHAEIIEDTVEVKRLLTMSV